ncbi:DUF4439 domain-containing protein [Nocardioides sp.]|uniref:DUF4439 domain-containing protein n=1 Tax=Nocardioides sp. TaxID=35761 RepID=UPI0026349F17|nr:DUF4439 domain-containing protein [Nocardioides sp.]
MTESLSPTPDASTSTSSASLPADDPRQEALAAEHAAVWTYAVLAARTSRSADAALLHRFKANYDAHEIARDTLLAALADVEGGPVVASPAYPLPARLSTPATLKAAAADVEKHCNEVYAWVVSRTTGAQRAAAITGLNRGAVRELGLRGTPEMFPGAEELADRVGLDTGPLEGSA